MAITLEDTARQRQSKAWVARRLAKAKAAAALQEAP
jgi:hypothetical protein